MRLIVCPHPPPKPKLKFIKIFKNKVFRFQNPNGVLKKGKKKTFKK